MIPAGLALVIVIAAFRSARRAARRRRAADDRAAAEDLLVAFAAELDAGADPATSLRSAVTAAHPAVTTRAGGRPDSGAGGPGDGELETVASGLAAGADPAALLTGCQTPALRQLGVALLVCRTGGARLTPVVRALAGQAQADARRAGELAAALAGPRSSGRLVAGLPLLGIAFAALLGAGPMHVLLRTPTGLACLAAGVLLDLLGLRWLRWTGDRVARRAEPRATRARSRSGVRRAGPTARAAKSGSHPGRPAPSGEGPARGERLLTDLPLALDLVAACLAAGATVPAALEATAEGIHGPLGAELRTTARALRLGAPADRATARLAAIGRRPPGALAWLLRHATARRRVGRAHPAAAAAQALSRVESSGARLADALTSIAARARAQAHDEAIGAARRAGVAAVAPLGLCFLPAFLLLGVVPTVLGSFHGLLPAS